MGMTDLALRDTQRAFDGVAASYHRSNVENPILREMRRRTWSAITAQVAPGACVLDLGCGPGTDDEELARVGCRVTAIDWSPAMVREARRRVTEAQLQHRVEVHHLGIHQLDRLPAASFDAAIANFGALNCVPDLADSARLIADRLHPAGTLVASVIGRVCPWELIVYLLRRDWNRLRIRFARDLVPVPLNGERVWTRYYSPAMFEREFVDAGFARVSLRTLGLLVPPPYLEGFAVRHASLVARLQWLEDRLGHRPGFRQWGDHFLIVLRKT